MRTVHLPRPFSLGHTCAPVAWAGGRWPNVDWIDGEFVWVGWEDGRLAWRTVRQVSMRELTISGSEDPDRDRAWADRVLGLRHPCPPFDDAILERLRHRFAGISAFAAGSVFDGLVAAIVGQSISIMAAAVAERRLARLFNSDVEAAGRRFWPLPRPEQLAHADPALVRQSGVTWRRAEALVAVGRAAAEGRLPTTEAAIADTAGARTELRRLPLVGAWTAESALLWGVGQPDAYPSGDVALLRAARSAYGRPEMAREDVDQLAEGWRPARGWAARLLWISLLGGAAGPSGGTDPRP